MDEQRAPETLAEVVTRLEAVAPYLGGNGNLVGSSSITQHNSSTPVWIMLVVVAGMFGWNLSLLSRQADMERKFDRMQDHLTAIYAMAPQLKPQPEEGSKP
jgi:hypothetical protein